VKHQWWTTRLVRKYSVTFRKRYGSFGKFKRWPLPKSLFTFNLEYLPVHAGRNVILKVGAVPAYIVIIVEIKGCPFRFQSVVMNNFLRYFSEAFALHTFECKVQIQPPLDQADSRTYDTSPGRRDMQHNVTYLNNLYFIVTAMRLKIQEHSCSQASVQNSSLKRRMFLL
jgi:hypothetical protein